MGDQELAIKEEMSPQMELLQSGAALVRLENTTQMEMSIRRPRDEKKILADALAELDTYRTMAEQAIYSKPVGEGKRAEGLSIRAAESLANRWTNSAYGVEQVPSPDGEGVLLIAAFLDYENNTRHAITKKVSMWYRTREKKLTQWAPDRFSDVVIPANQSKILREIILRSLPAGLKKDYENKVREILGKADPKERLLKMVTAFNEFNVTGNMLEAMIGKSMKEFTNDDLTQLLGTYNAIKDGELTVAEAFGATEAPKQEEPGLKPKDGYADAFGENKNDGQGTLIK